MEPRGPKVYAENTIHCLTAFKRQMVACALELYVVGNTLLGNFNKEMSAMGFFYLVVTRLQILSMKWRTKNSNELLIHFFAGWLVGSCHMTRVALCGIGKTSALSTTSCSSSAFLFFPNREQRFMHKSRWNTHAFSAFGTGLLFTVCFVYNNIYIFWRLWNLYIHVYCIAVRMCAY